MPVVEIIQENLLQTKCTYIAHQCNCICTKPHGLSAQIAKKYPWADVYSQRPTSIQRNRALIWEVPGTIRAFTRGNKTVLCLLAQANPGKPGEYKWIPGVRDGPEERLEWFKQCLSQLDSMNLKVDVAVPFMIGCGLAGGHWPDYLEALEAARTRFVLYQLGA